MWQKKLARRRGFNGQEGQSLLETAIAMPMLLILSFNMINWGYLWFMVLTLSAAPRMGAQYATQGGQATLAPGTTAVRDLVWENVTNAVQGATTANTSVRVCSSSKGVNSSTHVALCDSFGPAFSFPAVAADPEAPTFVLDSVDVGYTVTPIIPGAVFGVILPANLNFHRQVVMRSLY
ncbi:MAG TPA: TadE family protein [Candidatus Acidoferrum sp.]|nr:TadE family protein [Candidatus Acidoferrum sp.]